MPEVWKPVPSEPGVLASSEGRILLPPRCAPVPGGGFRHYIPKPRHGQVSKAHKAASHEFRIIMVRDETKAAKARPRKVHQLVCEAFHGPKPFPEAVVIHIDEDAHNNRPENLKWGTQKENLNMPKIKAWQRSPERAARLPRGEGHPSAKLTQQQVDHIRSSTGPAQPLADAYGVSRGHIYNIRKGRTRLAA